MEIQERHSWILLLGVLVSGNILFALQPSTKTSSEEHVPTGVWQSEQSDGAVVGIDLALVPASNPDAVYPEGVQRPQGSRLQVGVFQGHSQTSRRVENFSIVGWTGPGSENGSTTYENQRLEVHYRDPRSDLEMQIELDYDTAKDEWKGRFHRNLFDRQITLRRPTDQPGSTAPEILLTYTGTPTLFRVEMRNPGREDLLLNLGMEIGRRQYFDSVEFTLTTGDGRVLHPLSTQPALIAARVDPLIVPLSAGGSYSFLIDLDEYIFVPHVPGTYTLQASYTGKPVSFVNLDCKGIAGMHYWIGTVTAAPAVFTLSSDKESTADH